MIQTNRVIQDDCLSVLAEMGDLKAELIFADPPFNIGFGYDLYRDNRDYDEYTDWTRQWMRACTDFLTPTGAFWVAIGSEYAAEVRAIGRECDLHLRNWIIWHYTFGQNTKAKFARSHAHLFYFTKDAREFTFHGDAVRVLSDRQKEYADRRAHPLGRVPFDVWTEFPRVCGSFAEREGWHPCQMPESLLARIIRVSSNPGDLVFDPFAGSGTTLVTAKKTGRRYLGTEISPDYVQGIRRRLEASPTPAEAEAAAGEGWPEFARAELASAYVEASLPLTTLFGNEYLAEVFTNQFHARLAAEGYSLRPTVAELQTALDEMRRKSQLPRIRSFVNESAVGAEHQAKPRRRPRARRNPQRKGTKPLASLYDSSNDSQRHAHE